MADLDQQVMVGVREAAQMARVSTKQVRKWIAEGKVRAELREGKFGPTYSIEASSLPLSRGPMERGIPGVGQGSTLAGDTPEEGSGRASAGAMTALLRMLQDLQRRHEGAVARLGQLEGEREQRLALEERAQSLVQREAEARALAEAERQQAELQRQEAEAQRSRADELARSEAQARSEAEQERDRVELLSREADDLRRSVRVRTWAAVVAVLAAAAAAVSLLVRAFGR
jgi:hypothetical protein